ncbi:hypothetical protein B7P43_G05435 [Cryptotermes secundus]|uniref:Phorbol-ester/DAG-type domain-containing protein n=1 Tax=Cryptotermes secundus TaxID=105785 RepID=A0A2J7RP13_9NEOP|nr:hypothetical protein B7P43_G05435 [Cryptotermes secundus]
MAASSSLDGATVATSESKSSENQKNWGLLNLSPFRRKSSKPGTSSPSNQSPQRQMQASVKRSPDAEHIELVQLSNIKVSDALWKNIHGKTAVPGDVFFTNMPLMVTAKPVLLKHEVEQQVCNVDFVQMNEQPETRETKLKNSTALVWTDEEVEEMQRGIGHNFLQSDCCYPTWCDRCGDLLWGLYKTSYLRCRCDVTCSQEDYADGSVVPGRPLMRLLMQ